MSSALDVSGYAGALLLGLCSLPLLYKTIRDGHAGGVSLSFLIMWWLGELFTMVYVCETGAETPLVLNYTANLLIVFIVLAYRIIGGPRK